MSTVFHCEIDISLLIKNENVYKNCLDLKKMFLADTGVFLLVSERIFFETLQWKWMKVVQNIVDVDNYFNKKSIISDRKNEDWWIRGVRIL